MKYQYDNWNKALEIPEGEERQKSFKIIQFMLKGNFAWTMRRLVGGISTDDPVTVERWIKDKEMEPKSLFLQKMRKL